MPAEDLHYGTRPTSRLRNAAGEILDLQESLDRDFGSLLNVVAAIGERMSEGNHRT